MQVDYSPIQSNEAAADGVPMPSTTNVSSPASSKRGLRLRILGASVIGLALLATCCQYLPDKFKRPLISSSSGISPGLRMPVQNLPLANTNNQRTVFHTTGMGMVNPAVYHRTVNTPVNHAMNVPVNRAMNVPVNYAMNVPVNHAQSVFVGRSNVPNSPVHIGLAPYVPISSVHYPTGSKVAPVSASNTVSDIYKKRLDVINKARAQAYPGLDQSIRTLSGNTVHMGILAKEKLVAPASAMGMNTVTNKMKENSPVRHMLMQDALKQLNLIHAAPLTSSQKTQTFPASANTHATKNI